MIGGHSVLAGLPRRWGVLASVVVVHLLVLWWLQMGLVRDSSPLITPVALIAVSLDAPEPQVVSPPPPTQPERVKPVPRQVPSPNPPPVAVVSPPAVLPAPVQSTLPNIPATAATVPDLSASSPAGSAPVLSSPVSRAPATVAGSAVVVPPSAQAAYLHNPPPAYPVMSRRLAEQGRVMVRVLIGTDGLPQKAELQAGSGYDRLDRAALESVMRWRFVPGRRGDVPEPMWVTVPIVFSLE